MATTGDIIRAFLTLGVDIAFLIFLIYMPIAQKRYWDRQDAERAKFWEDMRRQREQHWQRIKEEREQQ